MAPRRWSNKQDVGLNVDHPERNRAIIVASDGANGANPGSDTDRGRLRSTTRRMSRVQRVRRMVRMFRRHRLATLRRSKCQRTLWVVVSEESEVCIGDGDRGGLRFQSR